MAAVPELFRHYPSLRASLSWTSLAHPTPVDRFEPPLHVAPVPRLWIKRDDQTHDVCGGYGAREFEFLLGEALRRGARHLVYFGDAASDRGLALASLARTFELEVTLALGGRLDDSRRSWLREQERRLGARVVALHRNPLEVLRLLRHSLAPVAPRRRPGLPLVLWPRRASLLETLGAANGVLELQRQIRCGLVPEPELLFVGCDSLPTLAGLAAGCELSGLRAHVLTLQRQQVRPARRLAQRALHFLQRRVAEIPRLRLRADRIVPLQEPGSLPELPESLGSLDLGTTLAARTLQALLAGAGRSLAHGPSLFWLAEAPRRQAVSRFSERRRRTTPAHA